MECKGGLLHPMEYRPKACNRAVRQMRMLLDTKSVARATYTIGPLGCGRRCCAKSKLLVELSKISHVGVCSFFFFFAKQSPFIQNEYLLPQWHQTGRGRKRFCLWYTQLKTPDNISNLYNSVDVL